MNLSVEAKVAIAVATSFVVLIVGRHGPGVANAAADRKPIGVVEAKKEGVTRLRGRNDFNRSYKLPVINKRAA
jgi:hypothetical protein